VHAGKLKVHAVNVHESFHAQDFNTP